MGPTQTCVTRTPPEVHPEVHECDNDVYQPRHELVGAFLPRRCSPEGAEGGRCCVRVQSYIRYDGCVNFPKCGPESTIRGCE